MIELLEMRIVKGDSGIQPLQLVDGATGAGKDISALTIKCAAEGVKTSDGTAYSIAAFECPKDDAATGKCHIPIESLSGTAFSGRFEIAGFDGAGKKTVFTPLGGRPIVVAEGII